MRLRLSAKNEIKKGKKKGLPVGKAAAQDMRSK
jgi:hypothetical protein